MNWRCPIITWAYLAEMVKDDNQLGHHLKNDCSGNPFEFVRSTHLAIWAQAALLMNG
jgi:hypothetical protein